MVKTAAPAPLELHSAKVLPANTAHFCLGKNNLPAGSNFLFTFGIWVFTETLTSAESPPEPEGSAGQLLTPAGDKSGGSIDHSL